MKTKRQNHGCVLIEDSGTKVIYVAGGEDGRGRGKINSIETLKLTNGNVAQNEWKLETIVLPLPLASFQMVKSNDANLLLYVVGGTTAYRVNKDIQNKIYALTKKKAFKEVGSLKTKRFLHQTLNVPLSQLKGCQ